MTAMTAIKQSKATELGRALPCDYKQKLGLLFAVFLGKLKVVLAIECAKQNAKLVLKEGLAAQSSQLFK